MDEKQVFDNNRSGLPPALSNNTGQMTVSCGWAALLQNDDDDDWRWPIYVDHDNDDTDDADDEDTDADVDEVSGVKPGGAACR